MKKASGSVRMGPVSLVALIIVLCMAVMCVLSITTARAMYSSTERQANSTVEVYACEQAGQQFVANVDEVLAGVRAGGSASKESALEALRNAGNDLVTSIAISPAQTGQQYNRLNKKAHAVPRAVRNTSVTLHTNQALAVSSARLTPGI